jgi:hypothetical protein
MSDDNVTPLAKKVNLNLDELEREGKAPFAFVLGGKRVEMKDPAEIDFKDLLAIEHPANFLKFALSDEAKQVLYENDLPGWKFNKIIEAYMEYYDLDPARAGKGFLH